MYLGVLLLSNNNLSRPLSFIFIIISISTYPMAEYYNENNYDSLSEEALKNKLKSATKLNLRTERELCQAYKKERDLMEELTIAKTENEHYKDQLDDFKTQISLTRLQIAMIEICSRNENTKIEAQIKILETHKKGFQDIFDRDRQKQEQHLKEFQDKESAEEVAMLELNGEVAAIEAECDALDQEIGILKKRNNAIMQKLRRMLTATEETRRKLMKRNNE